MEDALRVIASLVSVLESPAIRVTSVTTQDAAQIAGIIANSKRFVEQNTPQTDTPEVTEEA